MPMGGALALVELDAHASPAAQPRPGSRQREANRVRNLSGGDFVVTHQAGKNRQARGVGGSPRPGTLRVGVTQQIPDCRRIGVPCPIAVGIRAVQFVEKAVVVVEHQHVTIASPDSDRLRSVQRWPEAASARDHFRRRRR
jgi:hypothetical protein